MFIDAAVVTQYANQLRGLSAQQVELALSTKLLTAEQKQQIMAELGLIASENKIQSELLQTTLAQAGLSAEKQKAVLDGLNLINVTTGEVVANKACIKSELEEQLALHGVTGAQAEQIMSTLGMSTANATATVSFEVLTKSIKGAIVALGSFLFTTPAGWATLAVTAIVGAVAAISSYNKEQEELRQQAEESAKTLKEQTSAMKDLVSQYEAILDSEKTEAEKTEELNEWKQTLADTYGFEKDKLRDLNLEREEGIELLKQEIKASSQYQRDKWERDNKDQIDTAVDEIYYPEEYQQSLKEYYNRFYNDISDSVKQVMSKNNTLVTNAFEGLEQQKELYSELVKLKEQADLSEFDNIVFTEADQQLLDEVSDEIDILEKDIEKYGDIYKQHFDNKAVSFFDYYKENNNADDFEEFTEEGKQAYVSWRNGLLEEAGKTEYGSEVQNGLKDILQADYSEYEKYFENLATAKEKFLSNIKINSQADIEAKKSYEEFINELDSDELDILLGLDDTVFNQGINSVKKIIADIQTDPNYVIEVQIAIDEEKLENLRNSIKEITDSQKDLTAAIDEQKEHGQLSASTIQSLTEAGYAEALAIDKVTGAVTLNTTAYEKLINEKKKEIKLEIARLKVDLINPYKDETAAIADLERSLSTLNATEREATQIKIANMKAQLANSKLTDEQIRQKEQQLADLEAMLASLDAPNFDNSSSSSSGSDDDTPESVKNFEAELAKRQHEIATGKRKENADYYDWLLSAAHKAYDGLADYEEDLWKYEEQVYEWRKDHEQDLFDQRIENYKKLSDNALDDKITDFGISNEDVKNLEEFNKEMQKTWGLGNVDLTKRPKVAMDDGSTATVLSSTEFVWQGDEENGQYVAIHYTPILPDGTVLDDKSLEDYLYNTLEGSEDILKADNLGIVLKVDSNLSASEQEIKDFLNGNGTSDNVQKILDDIEKWDNGLHEVQEQWVELDDKVKSSDSATTYANKWDYARSQINSAIAETQNRINELKASGRQDVDDEIKQLEEDLEDLNDTLNEINSQEYEFNISVKEDSIEDLEKEFEKSGDISIYDKQIGIYKGLISDTQNEINRLLNEENYSMDSEEIQNLKEQIEDYSEDIADIWEKQTDVIKDNVDEQIEALNRLIENSGDLTLYSDVIDVYKKGQKEIAERISFYKKKGYAEDSQIIKALQKQWDEYQDSIYDTYEEHVNAQIDAYSNAINDQIDMLNKYKEEQDSQYEKEISALEEKKKALEKQTDELEKQEEIEEKKKALIDAQRNVYKSLRMVYDGNGNWVVKPTQEALDNVEEAKKDLEGVEQEQLIEALENQIDTIKEKQEAFDNSIDKQIDGLNNSNDEFERIMTESLETQKTLDAELIKAIMGEEKAQEFLNGYDEAQKAKETANASSANEQTDVQNDTQTNNNDSVKSTGQEILDLLHEAKPTMENLNTLIGKVKEAFPSYKNMGSTQSYQPDLQLTTREYESVVNNINNSPTLNNYFTITGANAEEIAKTVSDTFDTKIIKSFQAFYDGYYQASSKTMYGNK